MGNFGAFLPGSFLGQVLLYDQTVTVIDLGEETSDLVCLDVRLRRLGHGPDNHAFAGYDVILLIALDVASRYGHRDSELGEHGNIEGHLAIEPAGTQIDRSGLDRLRTFVCPGCGSVARTCPGFLRHRRRRSRGGDWIGIDRGDIPDQAEYRRRSGEQSQGLISFMEEMNVVE